MIFKEETSFQLAIEYDNNRTGNYTLKIHSALKSIIESHVYQLERNKKKS